MAALGGDATRKEELAAARKEGETDALLAEHSKHLKEINGSVADAAAALAVLGTEVHTLGVVSRRALEDAEESLRKALRELASDIRSLKEEQRIRDERVTVAASTLAEQTERRREELAAGAGVFTKRQQIVALVLSVVGIGVALLTQPWNW